MKLKEKIPIIKVIDIQTIFLYLYIFIPAVDSAIDKAIGQAKKNIGSVLKNE